VSSLIERTKPSLFLEFEGSKSDSRKTVDNLADFRESIHTHPIGIRLPVINLKRYSMHYHVRNKINLLHIVKEVASPGSWYVTCVTLRA
jgi:hypothetical protein